MFNSERMGKTKLFSKGFTLTELVIIASIVAITVLLLLPRAGIARGKDLFLRCKGNLHQIGQVEQLYALDSGGIGIPGFMSKMSLGGLRWAENSGHMPRRPNDLYVCPAWKPYEDRGETWVMYGEISNFPGNAPYEDRTQIETPWCGAITNLWEIDRPEEYMRFGDSVKSPSEPHQWYQIKLGWDHERLMHLRHDEKSNVLFADGHVESAGPERISDSFRHMIKDDGESYKINIWTEDFELITKKAGGKL